MKSMLRNRIQLVAIPAWGEIKSPCSLRCFSDATKATDEEKAYAKRFVVLLPWLGAPPSAVRKYENLYKKRGYEPIVYHAGVTDFLWPKLGLQSGLEALEDLQDRIQSKQAGIRPQIVVHSFSVGCYFYALMLWQMQKNPQQHRAVWNSISAQVCDSPVVGTLHEMAIGLGKTISPKSRVLAEMTKSLCMSYFGATKSHTVLVYEDMIFTFKHKAPNVPSMIVASKRDPMQVPEALEDLYKAWSDNHFILHKVWEDSGHVQHLKFHPQEYEGLLDQLLSESQNYCKELPNDKI